MSYFVIFKMKFSFGSCGALFSSPFLIYLRDEAGCDPPILELLLGERWAVGGVSLSIQTERQKLLWMVYMEGDE